MGRQPIVTLAMSRLAFFLIAALFIFVTAGCQPQLGQCDEEDGDQHMLIPQRRITGCAVM